KPDKVEVYTLDYAKERLAPQFIRAAKALDKLPPEACPDDFGVMRLAMNPSYIAKSFFPAAILRFAGLESVGSRTVKLTPEAWSKKGEPRECTTTELFVAGKRESFRNLVEWTEGLELGTKEALDLAHIERFSVFSPEERIVSLGEKSDHFFEVGIHLISDENNRFIQRSFVKYAQQLELNVFADLSFIAGSLWFIPVEGSNKKIKELAQF